MSRRLVILPVLSAAALLLAGMAPSAQMAKPTVMTARVAEESLAATRELQGTVVPAEEAELATRLAGRLQHVALIGTRVRRGEVVARLDPAQARLAVQREQARLNRLKAERDLSERQVQRLTSLSDAIPLAQRDEAVARAEVLAAQLAEAEVALHLAELDLAETEIRAPFAGVVSAEMKQVGEQALAGEAVVRLTNTERLELDLAVPVELATWAKPGDQVLVQVQEAYLPVSVRALVPGPAQSRQMHARLRLDRTTRDPIGSALSVRWPSAAANRALTVPSDAIVRRPDGAHLMRIQAGKAERVPVTLSAEAGMRVAVLGAVKAGDQVVVRGAERLQDGAEVDVVAAAPLSPVALAPPAKRCSGSTSAGSATTLC